MIGVHYLKRASTLRDENLSIYDSLLIKEKWHRVEKLHYAEGFNYDDSIIASVYDGYPISVWEDEETKYILEGIIYNIPEKKIREDLTIISESFSIEKVSGFVKEADGDFIVLLYKKKTKQVLIFNDELGALPFHYYYSDNTFLAGRNCTYLAALCKDSSISKYNIAELLCFNWNMDDRTIFKHIKALNPAMYLLCNENQGNLQVFKGQTVERSYDLTDSYKTKEEAIRSLRDLFVEGTKTRCEYAKTHGYAIVNTMSGGFDSRTVLGGIESCISSNDYMNVTYEYDRDESDVANRVLNAVGSKSEYVKLSYKNAPDLYNLDLSFKTEGKISTYTNSICYNDLMYSHEKCLNNKRLLYFGGFGGEYIRHPLFASIWNASNIGGKTCPTLKDVSKLCGVNYKEVKALVSSTFVNCHNSESFCKMFYDEYYRRYVRGAGEERIRMFYFSVQPLMSKPFILAIRNRVPLKWVGYEFYTNFLNAINPALTTIERHGGKPNIYSLKSLRKADYRNRSIPTNLLKWFKYKFRLKVKTGKMELGILLKQVNREVIDSMINKGYLEKHFKKYSQHTQCKIAALLYYVSELHKTE